MSKLRRLLHLSLSEWALLIAALATVIVVRLGLWFLPFRTCCRMLDRLRRLHPRSSLNVTPQRAAAAVRTASGYVPGATCLTQALATQAILAALGFHATLRIGVAQSEAGGVNAHAWLEHEDGIVIGWENRESFTAFPPFEVFKS